ncbi:M17 family peptidase N-terminal domain-containing protein [Comamonas sp. SY3]|uniref:M17 family peptidase N-terminal domain-containing protein n=1 Tax=Comamonas sp. SY3 TaxID=3243601 RepID=UPI003593C8D2
MRLELVTVDATGARVDLSCACMFTHEVDHQPMAGGLAHLDAALGGQLAQARRDGAFRAQPLETLLITPPAGAVQAPAIVVIGMGHPEDWSPATSAAAVACALRVGHLRGARSVAIAPSILDTGIHSDEDVNGPMLHGFKTQLDAQHQLHSLGLAAAPAIEHWVFDTGAAHFPHKLQQYQQAFASMMG